MEYSNYPFDSQKCSVQIGSAAYTDVYMVFSGKVKYRAEDQRAIQYKASKNNKDVNSHQFHQRLCTHFLYEILAPKLKCV